MDYSTEAKYFDGQSSASQQVNIHFLVSINEFRLQLTDEITFMWKLEDLAFEQFGDVLEIRNKNISGPILKIENREFSQIFFNAMKRNNLLDIHSKLMQIGFSKTVLIAICLLCIIVLSYFYILPPVAEKSASLLPESFDNYIGNTFMRSFVNESDVDVEKSRLLEQFAGELNLKNSRALHFTVVESKEINAFSLPNGQIVVYSAILNDMKSYEVLAALIGHEVSHFNNRHSTKMLCRNLAGYILVSLIFSDVNGIMAVLSENAEQLNTLSFSRQFEQQADEQGLKILMENQINPKGMVQLFEQLEKDTEFSVPEIISSHPLTKERKENMQKIISESNYRIKQNNNLKSIFRKIIKD